MHALRDVVRSFEPIPSTAFAPIPFGIAAIDAVLGGGLRRGALHEIAAPHEPDIAAATGFALALAACTGLQTPSPRVRGEGWGCREAPSPGSHVDCVRSDLSPHAGRGVCWIAEDMALLESGTPHGSGLEECGLAPERLIHVAAATPRDVLWAMEEALRCRAIAVAIGEIRGSERGLDPVAARRLSLAAAAHGAIGLLLRTAPPREASTAATRWIVGAARSTVRHGPGPPTFDARLLRNRHGPLGAWILEFCRDRRFILASAHSEPVARAVLDRPHRATRVA